MTLEEAREKIKPGKPAWAWNFRDNLMEELEIRGAPYITYAGRLVVPIYIARTCVEMNLACDRIRTTKEEMILLALKHRGQK